MKRILTLHGVCFAVAAGLLFAGQIVLGVGFALGGLILRLESHVANQARADGSRKENEGSSIDGGSLTDEESFCLDMTEPWMQKNSGWDQIDVYPSKFRYERQNCRGAPPSYDEAWEYEIKNDAMVFQRLLDRRKGGIYEDQYEVVNGCIQEDAIERKNREYEQWLTSKSQEDKEFWSNRQPYSADHVARLKREILWHELHGALKYFIL
jgi:hypothetical protein